MRPLHDNIIIRPVPDEKVTKSGLLIPDGAEEKPQVGEVIAVGNGFIQTDGTRVEMGVKAGDKIIYSKYAGTDFMLDGEKVLMLIESDVLACIED